VYANLNQLKQRGAKISLSDTEDDAQLVSYLAQAEHLIDRITKRSFAPELKTRYYDCIPTSANGDVREQMLVLGPVSLMSASSLSDGTGAIDASDYLLLPLGQPATQIERLNGFWTWETTPRSAIAVTGIWGCHDKTYENAWTTGATVQDAPLPSAQQDITVSDASPFAAHDLIRIADEWMLVTSVDSDANIITVERGVRGSAAASHALNDTITIWRAPADIEQACVTLAAHLYRTRYDEQPYQVDGAMNVRLPGAIPGSVTALLSGRTYIGRLFGT